MKTNDTPVYFAGCKTNEEANAIFRQQSVKLHPDKQGGSTEAFQELNRQYQEFNNPKRTPVTDYIQNLFNLLKGFYSITQINGKWTISIKKVVPRSMIENLIMRIELGTKQNRSLNNYVLFIVTETETDHVVSLTSRANDFVTLIQISYKISKMILPVTINEFVNKYFKVEYGK
jgi:hypothetical protein